MKKQILACFLCALLLFSLVACGGGGGGDVPPAGSTPKETGGTDTDESTNGSEVTLDFWIMADSTTGAMGEAFYGFVDKFEVENPGVKVNLVGMTTEAILASTITGASSNVLPDVFAIKLTDGYEMVSTGVIKDIAEYWNAEPEAYRNQFSPAAVEYLEQDGHVWGTPLTQTASLLYRNLDVLEAAGIDTSKGISDWDEWLDQMRKVKESGVSALPDYTLDGWGVLNFVAGVKGVKNGVENNRTTISEKALTDTYTMMANMAPYCSNVGLWDQAAKDMFFDGQMAFYLMGIWEDVNVQQAADDGRLNFDRIPIPGQTAGHYSGVTGGEFLAVCDNENAEISYKLISFICDAPQMEKLVVGLGRFTFNTVSMKAPGAMDIPLIAASLEAVTGGMPDTPFFSPFTIGTREPFANNAIAVVNGTKSAEEAAKDTIEEVSIMIADNAS